MRKTFDFFKKPISGIPLWRHLCVMISLAMLLVVLFFWAGYTFLPDVTTTYRRAIVNDTYSATTQPIGENSEVIQETVALGPIHGVLLNVTTYNRIAHGTVHVKFYDENGDLLAENTTEMDTLLDNTFHLFLFDEAINIDKIQPCSISITTTPDTPQDVIGLHRSDGRPDDYQPINHLDTRYTMNEEYYATGHYDLYQDGAKVDGMVALQYATHYVGTFIIDVYSFFAAFLTVLALAVYVLCFVFKIAIHRLFIVCALGLGIVFMFLIPPLAAPDEYSHIATAYHYSNILLGTAAEDDNNLIAVRDIDASLILNQYRYESTDIFAWQNIYENFFAHRPSEGTTLIPATSLRTFPPLLLIPALGLSLGRLLGLGTMGVLILGRFANLLFYAFSLSFCIKRMPFAKPIIFCIGLLPMCLQLAASFSYDTFAIVLCFIFISKCLYYAFGKVKVGIREILVLAVIAALLSPAKYAYILLLPFVFIIPMSKFSQKKVAIYGRLSVLAAGVCTFVLFGLLVFFTSFGAVGPFAVISTADATTDVPAVSSSQITEDVLDASDTDVISSNTSEAVVSAAPVIDDYGNELLPNGDAKQHFTLSYILTHIPATLQMLVHTVWQQGPIWLQGLIGGRLGEIIAVDITINWIFVIGYVFLLFASAIPNPSDNTLLSGKARFGGGAIVLVTLAALVFTCLSWTPVNYATLFGLQGRYLLPIFPLVLLSLRGKWIQFSKPVWRFVAIGSVLLGIFTILDAFLIILQLPVTHY